MAGSKRLPRAARLADPEHFRQAFASRRSLKGRWMNIHLRQRGDGDDEKARIGLVIGKRFCRLATRRNFLKRLIRERFRAVRTDLGSVDLVVRLVRNLPQQLEAETRESLRLDLDSLLAKLNQTLRRPT